MENRAHRDCTFTSLSCSAPPSHPPLLQGNTNSPPNLGHPSWPRSHPHARLVLLYLSVQTKCSRRQLQLSPSLPASPPLCSRRIPNCAVLEDRKLLSLHFSSSWGYLTLKCWKVHQISRAEVFLLRGPPRFIIRKLRS